MALAFPYNKYYGNLIMPNDDTILTHNNLDSNSIIKKLAIDISHKPEFNTKSNFEQFLEDALCGLYFESNIPNNHGLGSSGALVASIYNKYFHLPNSELDIWNSLKNIKQELASLESYFHGTSSGFDPLISFLNKTILTNAPFQASEIKHQNNLSFLLIDTNKQSSTDKTIAIFNNKEQVLNKELKELKNLNNECIITLLKNDDSLFKQINEFCTLQQQVLNELFVYPKGLNDIMTEFNGSFNIKLCGSGGGGFLIGFAKTNILDNLKGALEYSKIKYEMFHIPSGNVNTI